MKRKNNKGQVAGTLGTVLVAAGIFVAIIMLLVVSARVVNATSSQFTENTTPWNVSQDGLESLNTFSEFNPILAIAIVGGAVVSVVLGFFAVRAIRGG